MSVRERRVPLLVAAMIVLAAIMSSAFPAHNVSAAQITVRSLTLQAGATDGASKPGGVVNHFYGFTVPSTGTVGSIQFLYCLEASGTCTTPTGLVTTAATMGTESGATGFTLDNSTPGAPYLTRSAASISSGTVATYQLLSVTNPTTTNQAFYVRISTFASTDATGGTSDTGTVAASTSTQIVLTGTMPESLIFCTGHTVSAPAGIPDCATADIGAIDFNQLFSPADTATATSQMAASTNAISGYNITIAGPTLTSGSNTVPAMTVAAASTRGVRQFGLNLKANTSGASTPAIGTEVSLPANGTTLKGQAAAGYNTVDTFKFVSGDSVANSANGGAGPTDSQIYTSSYIVNVSGGQPTGTYVSTLTYVCTATF